jgi:GTP pyrophosphokinase
MKHSQFKLSDVESDELALFEQLSGEITDDVYSQQLKQALGYVFAAQDPADIRPSALDVSLILKQLGVDQETLIAALLSDPRLRDSLHSLTVEQQFNGAIANLVRHVNWLNTFQEGVDSSSYLPAEAEALRRMLLATVDDVRAVLIKLAFRVQRLRLLKNEDRQSQEHIAQETFEIYIPLANRLGLSSLQWEMEDLSFRYSESETYISLAKSMAEKRSHREEYIEKFIGYLSGWLDETGLQSTIYGRPKHLYSIWAKMHRKNMALHELADLLAVRIVVPKLSDCYDVLQLVHSKWQQLANEFDDYIANPKENGYQSIHTAIFGPGNQLVEIQIRTHEMHDFAEHGVAAHWRYKEGSTQDRALLKSISTLRRLLENRIDDYALLEEFKTEFFTDRVLVLTPKKEVVDLPKGATVLDFAYAIHTEIGHQCIGAMVNNQRVPLSYPLRSGECIEILTSTDSAPHLDWLNHRKNYVSTIRAKSSIRHWFKSQFKKDTNNLMVSSSTFGGIGNRQIKFSGCCSPQVGDRIMGQLSENKVIIIHRADCRSLHSEHASQQHSIIELNWGEEKSTQTVSIHIEAFDRQGLLLDITTLLNQSHFNVLKVNTETDIVDQSVSMELTFEINSLDELDNLLKQIAYVPNVINAVRTAAE